VSSLITGLDRLLRRQSSAAPWWLGAPGDASSMGTGRIRMPATSRS